MHMYRNASQVQFSRTGSYIGSVVVLSYIRIIQRKGIRAIQHQSNLSAHTHTKQHNRSGLAEKAAITVSDISDKRSSVGRLPSPACLLVLNPSLLLLFPPIRPLITSRHISNHRSA